jgi:hypothetical protein
VEQCDTIVEHCYTTVEQGVISVVHYDSTLEYPVTTVELFTT